MEKQPIDHLDRELVTALSWEVWKNVSPSSWIFKRAKHTEPSTFQNTNTSFDAKCDKG